MTTPRPGFINEDQINFIDYVNGAYSRPTGSEPVPRQSLIQEPMDRFENSILHLKDDGTSIETYQDIVRRARKWQHLLNKSNNIQKKRMDWEKARIELDTSDDTTGPLYTLLRTLEFNSPRRDVEGQSFSAFRQSDITGEADWINKIFDETKTREQELFLQSDQTRIKELERGRIIGGRRETYTPMSLDARLAINSSLRDRPSTALGAPLSDEEIAELTEELQNLIQIRQHVSSQNGTPESVSSSTVAAIDRLKRSGKWPEGLDGPTDSYSNEDLNDFAQLELAGGQEALNQRMEIIQFLEGLDLSPSYFSTNELKVEEAAPAMSTLVETLKEQPTVTTDEPTSAALDVVADVDEMEGWSKEHEGTLKYIFGTEVGEEEDAFENGLMKLYFAKALFADIDPEDYYLIEDKFGLTEGIIGEFVTLANSPDTAKAIEMMQAASNPHSLMEFGTVQTFQDLRGEEEIQSYDDVEELVFDVLSDKVGKYTNREAMEILELWDVSNSAGAKMMEGFNTNDTWQFRLDAALTTYGSGLDGGAPAPANETLLVWGNISPSDYKSAQESPSGMELLDRSRQAQTDELNRLLREQRIGLGMEAPEGSTVPIESLIHPTAGLQLGALVSTDPNVNPGLSSGYSPIEIMQALARSTVTMHKNNRVDGKTASQQVLKQFIADGITSAANMEQVMGDPIKQRQLMLAIAAGTVLQHAGENDPELERTLNDFLGLDKTNGQYSSFMDTMSWLRTGADFDWLAGRDLELALWGPDGDVSDDIIADIWNQADKLTYYLSQLFLGEFVEDVSREDAFSRQGGLYRTQVTTILEDEFDVSQGIWNPMDWFADSENPEDITGMTEADYLSKLDKVGIDLPTEYDAQLEEFNNVHARIPIWEGTALEVMQRNPNEGLVLIFGTLLKDPAMKSAMATVLNAHSLTGEPNMKMGQLVEIVTTGMKNKGYRIVGRKPDSKDLMFINPDTQSVLHRRTLGISSEVKTEEGIVPAMYETWATSNPSGRLDQRQLDALGITDGAIDQTWVQRATENFTTNEWESIRPPETTPEDWNNIVRNTIQEVVEDYEFAKEFRKTYWADRPEFHHATLLDYHAAIHERLLEATGSEEFFGVSAAILNGESITRQIASDTAEPRRQTVGPGPLGTTMVGGDMYSTTPPPRRKKQTPEQYLSTFSEEDRARLSRIKFYPNIRIRPESTTVPDVIFGTLKRGDPGVILMSQSAVGGSTPTNWPIKVDDSLFSQKMSVVEAVITSLRKEYTNEEGKLVWPHENRPAPADWDDWFKKEANRRYLNQVKTPNLHFRTGY